MTFGNICYDQKSTSVCSGAGGLAARISSSQQSYDQKTMSICIASKLNAKTVLDIENAKMAADDFKMNSLLLFELALLRSQMGGQVNVTVDASPSTDLNQVISEIREHYENVIGQNRKELETWYQKKITAVTQEVNTHKEVLVTFSRKVKDLKSTFQMLQIELQSHLSMTYVSFFVFLSNTSSRQVVTKVITVVETVVNGKIVESSETVDVDVKERN
ncbi:hypothetical protein FQN60_012315 [Etheostoma spectabile]|uniref:IF rod domain-containing protein n=1 Tax=Etheostoma spectabile TaxID=54343 RepID=A0A5J5DPK0_9PERO|nr:hypothetical protein FQN60_012315 [Etheostoma spectabile]